MKVIHCINVNDALPMGLAHLQGSSSKEDSRNGPVAVSFTPVTTIYDYPQERVLFSALRDANPYFHLFEALWMLAGRNDVKFPAHYASNLQLFSDDNETLNGAYGYRWREHFRYDQLQVIIDELKVNPASRRCVLAMWDAREGANASQEQEDGSFTSQWYAGDLKFAIAGSKDVPCNTHVYFRVMGRRLEMTVCNRSNDVVWGAYGANAVQFSMLQEYMASAIGLKVGRYYQIANNYHIYTEREDVKRLLACKNMNELWDDRYRLAGAPATLTPLFSDPADRTGFDLDCADLVEGRLGDNPAHTLFFQHVVIPMYESHKAYKLDNDLEHAKWLLKGTTDWHIAGREWLQRRVDARAAKAAGAAA